LPPALWRFVKQPGFFGLIIPRQYGGKGFSATAHSEIIARLTRRSGSVAVTVMVQNSLGPAELLLRYGTEQWKNYYLPRLARGEEVPCLALTGPEAGSDAGAMLDSGVVCRAGFQGQRDMLGIRLNWVIGGGSPVGQGWRMLMNSLVVGRSISLPANSVGVAKRRHAPPARMPAPPPVQRVDRPV
jgi:alkylation response protein AidB-like acyl-CoA dehydrogenase